MEVGLDTMDSNELGLEGAPPFVTASGIRQIWA